jgi:hypothetical protein
LKMKKSEKLGSKFCVQMCNVLCRYASAAAGASAAPLSASAPSEQLSSRFIAAPEFASKDIRSEANRGAVQVDDRGGVVRDDNYGEGLYKFTHP